MKIYVEKFTALISHTTGKKRKEVCLNYGGAEGKALGGVVMDSRLGSVETPAHNTLKCVKR